MSNLEKLLGGVAPWPNVDHSAFGEVEVVALSRYQKLTGAFLARNWVAIPHVTHIDDVDITDCEARRVAFNAERSTKVTMVALAIKALANTLVSFPAFNASLAADGQSLILKKYVNVGVAVDTPNGLLVPVIRDCDLKDVAQLAGELTSLAEKARSKGLSIDEMSGSSMSITSLGHIGGRGFTPIINAPDVAILGLTRARQTMRRESEGSAAWRLELPVSLSYDHRVINGADAARFVRAFGDRLNEASLFAS